MKYSLNEDELIEAQRARSRLLYGEYQMRGNTDIYIQAEALEILKSEIKSLRRELTSRTYQAVVGWTALAGLAAAVIGTRVWG